MAKLAEAKTVIWPVVTGVLGVAIGAGGMVYSQKQATTAENQYYMELDQLRHEAFLDEAQTFEAKLEYLMLLKRVRNHGFLTVFEDNLESDIEELTETISKIAEARKQSEEAAKIARQREVEKATAAAQARKEQAVKLNPMIYLNCGNGTGKLCP